MPLLVRGGGGGKSIKDATAVPGDVAKDKVFYNNDGRQIGTHVCPSASHIKTGVLSNLRQITDSPVQLQTTRIELDAFNGTGLKGIVSDDIYKTVNSERVRLDYIAISRVLVNGKWWNVFCPKNVPLRIIANYNGNPVYCEIYNGLVYYSLSFAHSSVNARIEYINSIN